MRSDLDPDTGVHTEARTVYNISGQQGEYCMVGHHLNLERGHNLEFAELC